ncbi:MAG: hypothetical protein ABIQ31_13690 [Ferruginibacter sp.]
MKVVAYGIQSCEREFLATANQKKHDITLIGNPLTEETLLYAVGKQAVIVPENIPISTALTTRLAGLGIDHVLKRALCTDESEAIVLQEMAAEVIRQLDLL